MLILLIVISHNTLQILLELLFLLDLEFVLVGQLPSHDLVVQINDSIFLNDFQVSLLFFINESFFMLLDAVFIRFLLHLFFRELLLVLSDIE